MAFFKDGAAYIPLQVSNGRRRLFAIIDEEDFERVSRHKWYGAPAGCTIYVRATTLTTGLPKHQSGLHSFVMRGEFGQRFDHRDGNGLNNRKGNLRLASAQQNACNTFKQRNTTSKFKGVKMTSSGKWAAYIKMDGNCEVLGMFIEEADAARAYDAAALRLFGDFAKTNEMMGLYTSPEVIRDTSGFDIQNTVDLGEFRSRSTDCSRVNVAKVVGLVQHKRKTGVYLYRLETGRTVPRESYVGKHPAPDELERMKASLREYKAAKRVLKEALAANA